MTKQRCCTLMGLVLTLLMVGCNGNPVEQPTTATTTSTDAGGSPTQQVATSTVQPENPAEAVKIFLQSLRKGDPEVAAGLLTQKARTETAKLNLVVEPPGTPAATYSVEEVEMQENPNEAHVLSNWSEPTEGGQETYQVVWITKKDNGGWRISGMATRQEGSDEALLVDFEDAKLLAELLGPAPAEPTSATEQTVQGTPVQDGTALQPPAQTATPTQIGPANQVDTATQPQPALNGLR